MSNPIYRVFISSTYEDLKPERREIMEAVLEMRHLPLGMELFNAGNDEQWKAIQRGIDSCDYYVIIVAHRYGSVTKEGISYTEKESDYARSLDKPVITLGISDEVKDWPHEFYDTGKNLNRLKKFKTKILADRTAKFWTSTSDLGGKFSRALNLTITDYRRPGLVPADEAASPLQGTELARLSSENAELKNEVERLKEEVYLSAAALAPDKEPGKMALMRRAEALAASADINRKQSGDIAVGTLASDAHNTLRVEAAQEFGRGILSVPELKPTHGWSEAITAASQLKAAVEGAIHDQRPYVPPTTVKARRRDKFEF